MKVKTSSKDILLLSWHQVWLWTHPYILWESASFIASVTEFYSYFFLSPLLYHQSISDYKYT